MKGFLGVACCTMEQELVYSPAAAPGSFASQRPTAICQDIFNLNTINSNDCNCNRNSKYNDCNFSNRNDGNRNNR